MVRIFRAAACWRLPGLRGASALLSACAPGSGGVSAKELTGSLSAGNEGSAAVDAYAVAEELQATLENEDAQAASYDFAARLFQQLCSDTLAKSETENLLVSPLSLVCALAMLQNGAQGETLAQLQGLSGLSTDALNVYLAAFSRYLQNDNSCYSYGNEELSNPALKLANSIWVKQDEELQVKPAYLEACKQKLGAEVFEAPFNGTTANDINSWVSKGTDGKIEKLLDEVPEDAVMYLVNTLAFGSKWQYPYEAEDVSEGTFTCADGTETTVSFMASHEGNYYENDAFEGFSRAYNGYSYRYVGLLPKNGASLAEACASLTGASLRRLLNTSAENTEVDARLPKFKYDFDANVAEQLKALGATDAFDLGRADFSAMGSYAGADKNLYVGRVLHKTTISVDEEGTEAAAASAVEMMSGASLEEEPPQVKEVILNRPFVYAIVEGNTGVPVFLGAVNQL